MAPVAVANQKSTSTGKKGPSKYVVNVVANNEESVFDVDAYEKFLNERIKVEGRTGSLGDAITITTTGNKVTIVSNTKFSGKYLKYLTKKFLKKNNLRDWLRVVAASKGVYEIKFFNLMVSENEEEEEEEESEAEDEAQE